MDRRRPAVWDVGSAVNSIAISSDGTRVVSGSNDSMVRVWDFQTGTLVLGPLEGHTEWVCSVVFSPDDKHIISSSNDCTIRIWDSISGVPACEPLKGHTQEVSSVAVSPDGAFIASGSHDTTIRVWNVPSGTPVGEPLQGHRALVFSVVFSLDSNRIVSGSYDHTIRIWDLKTGAPIGDPITGHTTLVQGVGISLDGTRIVSGSADKTIRIWDMDTGAQIGEPLKGHSSEVVSVSFSPDDTRIVSGSRDGTIRVWEAHSGTPIGEPLKGHRHWVYSAVFSPDGASIVSGSWDCTIRTWKAPKSIKQFEKASSKMSPQQMFECLLLHGCKDLSSTIDPDGYSSSAIATGGFGDIWRGAMKDGTLVAIKCLRLHLMLGEDKKGNKRTMREIYYWTKAEHENIQTLIGVVMFQGRLGMVSPWMDNGNLQSYLEANPELERYPLCTQLARGVSYLHDIGMVHGDLKAANVLVSQDGVLKLNDFDHAILSDATLRFSTTTQPGGGTLRWMAPELLQQDDDEEAEPKPPAARNERTDIYALGMMMLETITGTVPYAEFRNDMGIYRAIDRKQPPRRPKELPNNDERANVIWLLLLKCWDHDPDARPKASSALKLFQDLTA